MCSVAKVHDTLMYSFAKTITNSCHDSEENSWNLQKFSIVTEKLAIARAYRAIAGDIL